ncbi:hypothetical protein [Engelhardtia mirabilis]|uniref:Right handed beta helix domain-containing protein n=1 Tax=Engelhardtia mirabilis TaxID=2528011 RepID=A0A518BEC9_9BACT|nr:hypothetical protein Pla133_04120 [Planctomycetes bacterium Pla133]QDU99673.1 hypothetical protein Pla86_04120 [Planctomycetes bacterium Pla86]
MLTKTDRPTEGFWLGVALLLTGLGIGLLLDPSSWSSRPDDVAPAKDLPLHRYLRPPEGLPEPVDNGLATIEVSIEPEAAQTLQRVRERALDRGMIIQTDDDTVDAVITIDGRPMDADVRIKGDWLDHVIGDKWSLRITLKDDKAFGMRVFSVQAPSTRGHLWEWLVLEASRREGLLAPRSDFVNLVVNGHAAGVYYLEEHFSKELLESQDRREGPIVLWDESTHWDSLLQAHDVFSKEVEFSTPESARDAIEVPAAFVRAYGEKRLGSSDSLNRSYFSAVEQMRDLQRLVIASGDRQSRQRRMQALEDLKGKTLERLVDVDRLAMAHALASLFQIEHSLYWQNMRFYHDPVVDRLEPIMFDNMAQTPSAREPVPHRPEGIVKQFVSSDAYYNGVFRHLGELCAPGYLDRLFDALRPDLERFEAALMADAPLPEPFRVDSMLQRLRTQVAFLRTVVYPVDPLNCMATYELVEGEQTPVSGFVNVSAWSTTQTPVVVEGFRFSNGVFIAAQPRLVPGSLGAGTTSSGGVVLPRDGRTVHFRFELDERLANLETVDGVLQAVLEKSEQKGQLELDIEIVSRPIGADATSSEPLTVRRIEASWIDEGGRPVAPTLAEALERHPFLEWDPVERWLVIQHGTWDVDGDLVVPHGTVLRARGIVRLRFDPDAVLLTDAPLDFEGLADGPIVLEPKEGFDRWKGVAVLEADGRSTWRYVTVRNTDAVARAGWVVTGGITFYHSPVTMQDCLIEGTLAEDGTNIFGADFLMERVTFAGCVSDSFDGDFVSGTVRECTFRDGLADGVDVSGSDIDILDCRFLNMGDKAVSAGERSIVRVRGGLADGVSIGIASKDDSTVDARDMTILGARTYALAAFIKKPEFGPARMTATNITIRDSVLGDSIVQSGCSVELEGALLPTVDLDVNRLYEEKILGQ